MSDDRLPAGRRFSNGVNWRAVRVAADSSALCGRTRRSGLSNIAFRSPVAPLAMLRAPQSAEVQTLFAEAEVAVAVATDRYDLANRLNLVLDKALTLPAEDQVTISATVSVAQSSFEYWDQQYALFEQEVIAEYSPCIEQQAELGYSSDDLQSQCLTGSGTGGAVTLRMTPPPAQQRQVARRKPHALCGPGLKEGFRRIANADTKGAFNGALAGAIAGGFNGAVLGALASGGTASTFAALENAWQTLKCMYGVT